MVMLDRVRLLLGAESSNQRVVTAKADNESLRYDDNAETAGASCGRRRSSGTGRMDTPTHASGNGDRLTNAGPSPSRVMRHRQRAESEQVQRESSRVTVLPAIPQLLPQ